MTRDEALRLLKAGWEGVSDWNWRCAEDKSIPDLKDADLSGAELKEANLSDADLRRANLGNSRLKEAFLSGADLHRADLSGANLSGADLFAADFDRADRSGANLRCADASDFKVLRTMWDGADFSYAHLPNANLHKANLRLTEFSHADLRGVDLSGADLDGADFAGADLSGAKLHDAYLGDAHLSYTDVSGTDFQKAKIAHTVFDNVDLSKATNLEAVEHQGPSTLATSTLTASKGNIPEPFLKGCGLAPWEITMAKLYDPTLTPAQITDLQYKMFDQRTRGPLIIRGVFVSYSREDSEFVDKLRDRLMSIDGIYAWVDRHDAVSGSMEKQVQKAIRESDALLVVLSEASVVSAWVEHELEIGLELQQESIHPKKNNEPDDERNVFCPIALDDSWKKKKGVVWSRLRKMNVLDFSKAKEFETQYQKLVRGMKLYYGELVGRVNRTQG